MTKTNPRVVAPGSVEIAYLADRRGAIPRLARWHHDQWRSITPGVTLADRVALLWSRARRRTVPTAFVATVDGAAAGLACLVAQDVDALPDLTPWLASVLVAPEYRGRGIGSALAERAVDETRALDYPALYLATFDRMEFYARLGWQRLDETDYLGRPAVVMVRELAA